MVVALKKKTYNAVPGDRCTMFLVDRWHNHLFRRIRRNAKKLGELMRDRPISPAEEVAWWAGYLIRTGGAKHLRSGAADLPWQVKIYFI